MNDIQRWHATRGMYSPTTDGEFVTYTDHVAAVAAARTEAVEDYKALTEALGEFFEPYHMPVWGAGYSTGQRDERERVRAAVEALAHPDHHYVWNDCVNEVLAVIDGTKEAGDE